MRDETYLARLDAIDAPTDHELVTDHSQCDEHWPECPVADAPDAVSIARALADCWPPLDGEHGHCTLCGFSEDHAPDCPWRLAQNWAHARGILTAGEQPPGAYLIRYGAEDYGVRVHPDEAVTRFSGGDLPVNLARAVAAAAESLPHAIMVWLQDSTGALPEITPLTAIIPPGAPDDQRTADHRMFLETEWDRLPAPVRARLLSYPEEEAGAQAPAAS